MHPKLGVDEMLVALLGSQVNLRDVKAKVVEFNVQLDNLCQARHHLPHGIPREFHILDHRLRGVFQKHDPCM